MDAIERFQAGSRKKPSATIGRATGRGCTRSDCHGIGRLGVEDIFLSFRSHGSPQKEETDSSDASGKHRLFKSASSGTGGDDIGFGFLPLLELALRPGLPLLDFLTMYVSLGSGRFFFFA